MDDHVFFGRARFTGPVNFGSNFEAGDAQLMDKEKEADFNSIKVGQLAFFRRTRFAGQVNFVSAQIGSNFEAHAAQFTNKEKEANFDSLRVKGITFLTWAVFDGSLSIADARLLDLLLEGTGTAALNVQRVDGFSSPGASQR